MLNRLWKIPNFKHQIKPLQGLWGRGQSSRKKIQITNFKISGEKVCFEHLDFDIRYCLEFIPQDIEQIRSHKGWW